MSRVPRAWREAAERYGPLVEGEAHHYGLPNGATLLAKVASGESGFNTGAVSSAGARGGTQFEPAARAEILHKYGVDAWGSPEEAIHAAALFIRERGFGAYNPGGGQSYIHYILGQPVSIAHQGSSLPRGVTAPVSSGESGAPGGISGDLMHLGLVGALVIGGVAMVGLGATRMLGTAKGRT